MTLHFSRIMLCRKQVAMKCIIPIIAFVADQTARRYGGKQRNGWKWLARHWLRRSLILERQRIKSTGRKINNRIAQPAGGHLKKIVGADHFTLRSEHEFHEVHEPPAHNFRVGAIRATANECAALSGQRLAILIFEPISIRTPHRHVEEPVGAEDQSVQAAVVGMPESCEDHMALFCPPVAIAIFKRDQIRWVGHV